jgi:RNA polymerase sigma-70 factor (ECF subfamily)
LSDDLEEHSRHLFRFALGLTGNRTWAEDLVQETLLRAIRQRSSLPASPRAWLFTVCANLWRDEHRRQRRRPPHQPLDSAAEPGFSSGSADAETREHLEMVLRYFGQLPPLQRAVLYLRAVEGYSVPEIAAITGSTTGSVSASLSQARKRMRSRFGEPEPSVKNL